MAVFPETPKPVYPLIVTPQWDTLLAGKTDAGKEQRRQKSLFSVYDVNVRYRALDSDGRHALYYFYQNSGQGAFGEFYIFDPSLHANLAYWHGPMYVGSGDGSTTTFTLPGRSTTSLAVYAGNVLQTLTTQYTVSTGTGEGGADQITFVNAPASSIVIHCTFYGIPRYKVRFMHDNLSFEMFMTVLYQTGIQLKGLAGA